MGYVEGQNLVIEWRDAEGKPARYAELAAELVRLEVDVIVAANPAATLAARRSTGSIFGGCESSSPALAMSAAAIGPLK